MTDKELDIWAKDNGAEKELAQWREEKGLEEFDMDSKEVVVRKVRNCS